MKNRILPALLLLATLTLALPATAALSPATYNMGASIASAGAGSTNAYAILPASSANEGAPVVTYVNATSDKAGAKIQCYRVGEISTASKVNSTTSVYVDDNASPSNATLIVIWHASAGTYERLAATAASTATNCVTTVAPATAVAPGDMVYSMSAAGFVPLGATNVAVNGPGVFYGQLGLPLLIDVDGTSACAVNVLSGIYLKEEEQIVRTRAQD